MKKLNNLYCFFFLVLVAACTKNNPRGTATLLMFNAVTGSDTLVTSFNGTTPITYYKTANILVYGKVINPSNNTMNGRFSSYSGNQSIALFNKHDTTPKSKPVFDINLNLPVSTINSLFLTGTLTEPDFLFTRDNPPYHPATDSSVGIRIVNLSPGSMKLSVNLAGQANGSEVISLGYKEITEFKNYPVVAGVNEYIYEFRDAANGNLLASFTIDVRNKQTPTLISNLWRYRNFTLMLYGNPGSSGTDKQAVQIMDNN